MGFFQARILENERESVSFSVMLDSFNPMDCRPQAPFSKELSRQEYCSGLTFPSPRDLPDPGVEPGSAALQAEAWSDCHFQSHHENPTHITLSKPS